jgi:transposase InsO family protein
MQKSPLVLAVIVTSGVALLTPVVRAQTEQNQETNAPLNAQTQELRQVRQKVSEEGQQLRIEAERLKKDAAQIKKDAELKRQEIRGELGTLREEAQVIRGELQQKREVLKEELAASRAAALARRAQKIETMTAAQREHFEKIMAEREARRAEKLTIQADRREAAAAAKDAKAGKEVMPDETSEKDTADRLQSRNVAARIKGATFTIDEATNIVTLTTPSGQTHELTHLPDQVVSHLHAKKNLGDTEEISELEITSIETGVIYSATIPKKKKFLGLLSREVPFEVQVDDATGEISEKPLPTQNFMTRILNALSF